MMALRDVSFAYGGRPVLREVSLTLPDGEVTALIGPNGAGKSTALRVLAGILRPGAGAALADGTDVRAYPRRALARRLAYLPQDRPMPALSVETLASHGRFAYLDASRRLRAQDRRAVEAALERVGLAELRDRDVRTLSGGQRQKAYLAMLIAQDAPNLLLDEPLNHLDIGCQLDLCALLRELAREGRCVGVVLHDLSLVPRLCGRAALLDAGALRFEGPAEDCLQSRALRAVFHVKPVAGVAFEREL